MEYINTIQIHKKQKGWICEQTHNIRVNSIKQQSTYAYKYD